MNLYLRGISFFLLLNTCLLSYAYNLRQISSREGLSNSSVICLFQDSRRFLWIGTFDGLNMYDGHDIHIYKPDMNSRNSISGNVIRQIVETEANYLWISTKWGLNKFSKKDQMVEECYSDIKEDTPMTTDRHENLYILDKKGVINFYDRRGKKFINIPFDSPKSYSGHVNFFIDSHDTIHIVDRGIMEKYTLDLSNLKINRYADFKHHSPLKYTSYVDNRILFVDTNGGLYVIDEKGRIEWLKNIQSLLHTNGDISSIIFDERDIIIGFRTNGLIRLNADKGYAIERMDITCGVFSLWKDKEQNIIWIGTDGQGVYACTKDEYTFKGLNLLQLPIKEEKPIRAIQTDRYGDLWLGTKDNGIIRIKQYNTASDYSSENVTHYTQSNGLSDNAVFALSFSINNNVLWIGSGGPSINYYSYYDSQIHTLINKTPNKFTDVHTLYEASDSVLWVASGSRLIKTIIKKNRNEFEVADTQLFAFDVKNKQASNQIYALCNASDSILWIGMRGNGVIRFNKNTGNYNLITFDEQGIAPMNDVLCVYQDTQNVLWVGSSYGLTRLIMRQDGKFDCKNYNESNGLINNTVHGIVESRDGKLWLSTNTGIALFDPVKESFRNFNQKTGLKTIEFCDNAYFNDRTNSVFFFGGVDGLVWIRQDENKKEEFNPEIYFTQLRIFNEKYNLTEFIKNDNISEYIELKYNQNFFTISFVAMDFINGENSSYSYRLENFSNIWMDTHSNEAQFTNIPPGNYILQIKYNDGTGGDKYIRTIRIKILPPWYLSVTAKIIYIVLILCACGAVYRYLKYKYERKKAKITRQMEHKYKEEMYERKLRFFTNITHEFCTPLTLIYGPSDRLLHYDGGDAAFVKKYAQIIKSNSERLNDLIQEVIDFRRIETGNQICHIQKHDISRIITDISDSFIDLSERNEIRYETHISDHIQWNTDLACFTKIVVNLISNAFKYTSKHGQIRVSVSKEENLLIIKVYNTGEGISKENLSLIFNRYLVLDNVKSDTVQGLSSRNGLGLAICQSMTELLQGKIEVNSVVNEYSEFVVSLPFLTIEEAADDLDSEGEAVLKPSYVSDKSLFTLSETNDLDDTTSKSRILVIEDNEELLWMLKELLSDEYIVDIARDGRIGFDRLIQSQPHLVITDIMMPNMDGISLTRQIKENKHIMNIPLVILSAKSDVNDKIEGIESGADAYIPKPFDPQYLKAIIRHLIDNKKKMEEYYNTSASAYNFAKGHLLIKEDKNFLEDLVRVIDANIANSSFAPEDLADEMKMSVRNLYRKLKSLDQLPPKDFIKEQRIIYSAKLLVTTTLTVQEIMYASGFTTRSHFYKEFTRRYNLSPKEYRDENKLKETDL